MERLHMTGGPKGKHGQEHKSYQWREALAQCRSPSRYVRELRIFPGTRASNCSIASSHAPKEDLRGKRRARLLASP
jgi:hypothetical protein